MTTANRLGALAVSLCLLGSTWGAQWASAAGPAPLLPQQRVAPLTWDSLANAEYLVGLGEAGSEQKVKLVDGQYEAKTGPGATEIISVELAEAYALGDLNGDGIADATVVLAYNTGGTGVFNDVEAVLNEGGKPVQAASAPLEDRIILRTLAIVQGKIELDMVHAGPAEPACCPTEEVFWTYALKGNDLVRISDRKVDAASPRLPFPAWTALANREYRSKLVPSGVVKLKDGTYEESAPGAAITTTIQLGRAYATGDLTGGGLPDAAVVLVANPYQENETGELAAVLSENGKLVDAGAVLLGDGVKVRALAIVSGRIVVDVTTPTGKAVRTYRVEKGKLAEVTGASQDLGRFT